MRPEHEARRTVVREWMSLPRERRQNEEQAAAFATQAAEKHKFTCSGDRYRRIMTWLSPASPSRRPRGLLINVEQTARPFDYATISVFYFERLGGNKTADSPGGFAFSIV
jgi:hypothetical protein